MRALDASHDFTLQTLVIGSHWSPRHGFTSNEILADGFKIDGEVRAFAESDKPAAVANAMSQTLTAVTEELTKLKPDLVLLLGDRYEIFSTAVACPLLNLPIAHLAGGDVTQGAIDDAFRHGITKIAALHFVTNPEARDRVLQLGEMPERVFCVGSTAIETINETPNMSKVETLTSTGLNPDEPYLLLTIHPETNPLGPSDYELSEIRAAITFLSPRYQIVITAPNEDPGFEKIETLVADLKVASPDCVAIVKSGGSDLYVNLLRHAEVCVGNSSSGLYEAPSLGTPAVNIGSRQSGRLRASSVIDCEATERSIVDAVEKAAKVDMTAIRNPYDGGKASEQILLALRSFEDFGAILGKPFVDART
jgi:UDP-N-acetylglucosamine 2-epimerase (non-hydrolysing)/GDP/UDP-N,N'-diacetylbacillosamine 2-epimerase (hydrolysing)